mmetsp:Transcript_17723/g.22951  ORF Transcript_17723/g.22951 Transcript_17723/m.22951 type:complete len:112 (+) Transcript_17723:725-1060(+)
MASSQKEKKEFEADDESKNELNWACSHPKICESGGILYRLAFLRKVGRKRGSRREACGEVSRWLEISLTVSQFRAFRFSHLVVADRLLCEKHKGRIQTKKGFCQQPIQKDD